MAGISGGGGRSGDSFDVTVLDGGVGGKGGRRELVYGSGGQGSGWVLKLKCEGQGPVPGMIVVDGVSANLVLGGPQLPLTRVLSRVCYRPNRTRVTAADTETIQAS